MELAAPGSYPNEDWAREIASLRVPADSCPSDRWLPRGQFVPTIARMRAGFWLNFCWLRALDDAEGESRCCALAVRDTTSPDRSDPFSEKQRSLPRRPRSFPRPPRYAVRRTRRSEERRVGKEGRSRWSPHH